MDVSRYMVRNGDRLFLCPTRTPVRSLANPEFVELICAVHELQFGTAQLEYFRNAFEDYVYVESCRDCVLEALHRFDWVLVAYPAGCPRHTHNLNWIHGENFADHLILTPEQSQRYAYGVGEACPPWFRNSARGTLDAYWKRLIF